MKFEYGEDIVDGKEFESFNEKKEICLIKW